MTVGQALNDLAGAGDSARAAMAWALDHWDQAGPRFADILGNYSRGQNRTDEVSRALFLIIHMRAEMEDPTVFGSLCRLLWDGDAAVMVLSDAITATPARVLISTFDDDSVLPFSRKAGSTTGGSPSWRDRWAATACGCGPGGSWTRRWPAPMPHGAASS